MTNDHLIRLHGELWLQEFITYYFTERMGQVVPPKIGNFVIHQVDYFFYIIKYHRDIVISSWGVLCKLFYFYGKIYLHLICNQILKLVPVLWLNVIS